MNTTWLDTFMLLFWAVFGAVSLSTCGCARAPMNVPDEAAEYVNAYIETYGGDMQLVSIHFDLEEGVGWCSTLTGRISISPEAWKNASLLYRKYIVFHELGHCVGGLGHTTAVDARGCPTSFMWDGWPSETCLRNLMEGK